MKVQRRIVLAAALGLVGSLGLAQVAAKEPNLQTPAVEALKADYRKRVGELETHHRAAMQKLLEERLDDMKQQQARARVSGNTTILAVSAHAIQHYEAALEKLKKSGTFDFSGRVRREVETAFDACIRQRKAGEAGIATATKKLDGEFADKLAAALKTQLPAELAPEARLALWAKALGMQAATAAATGEAAQPAKPVVRQFGSATNANVRATFGEAASWMPLARIDVLMGPGMEIVTVPIAGLTEVKRFQGTSIESGQTWTAKVTPYLNMPQPAGTMPAFRLSDIAGFRHVEVVGWPARRNGFGLELRVRGLSAASRHAGLLEVASTATATPLTDGTP